MVDEKKEKVNLNSLSDDDYKIVKEKGHDKFKKLFNGELVVNKTKDYLMDFKKEFKKALSLGYTYTEIANVIRDEKSGVTFTARQIREFCEENGIRKDKKVTTKKAKGGLKKEDEQKEDKKKEVNINSDQHIDEPEEV